MNRVIGMANTVGNSNPVVVGGSVKEIFVRFEGADSSEWCEQLAEPERCLDEREQELVEAARCGDRAAFAGLVRSCERAALGLAYSVVGDAHLAGDVTQEAFIRAWRGIDKLDDPGRFRGWLGRIVRNVAADQLRARQRMRIVQPDDGRQTVDPTIEADRSELRGTINGALATLDEISRAIVVLRYYEQLSSKEIAELMEMTPASVDMRLSRARVELRDRLSHLAASPVTRSVRPVGERVTSDAAK